MISTLLLINVWVRQMIFLDVTVVSFGGWLCEQTNMQDYREAEKVVIRRFSDFVWLHLRLTECYKGVIIAALPGKSAVGKTVTILRPHFGCKGYKNFVTLCMYIVTIFLTYVL